MNKTKASRVILDAHNHIQFFPSDQLESVLSFGPSSMLVNSTSFADFDSVISIHKANPKILPGIGIHPWYLTDLPVDYQTKYEQYASSLEEQNIPFFVGEVGIDGGKIKKFCLK